MDAGTKKFNQAAQAILSNQVANLSMLRGRRSDGNALHMRDWLKDYLKQ